MTTVTINAEQAGKTLAAIVRSLSTGSSWREAQRFIEVRRAKIDGELCLDPARRVKEGQVVELLPKSAPKVHRQESLVIRYLDEHLVVVEKPSGINTVRHPSERAWNARRKGLSPTLEDLVPPIIVRTTGRVVKGPFPRLRIVQRLDKETSGLVVFARSVEAERGLGQQFRRHNVVRRYMALVPGYVMAQKIATRLIRDRGDGRRGSTLAADQGKSAVTHIEIVERLPGYSLVGCRLETGRTHQIRIHLAELGHPVCGDKVYRGRFATPPIEDKSGSPRLFLHATELGFVHPTSGETMFWNMPLPADLSPILDGLR